MLGAERRLGRRHEQGRLRPGSAADVAKAVRWAGRLGSKVAPRGVGDSVWGRSQVDAGLVVDLSTLRAVRGVWSDRVVVDAGARWSEVLAATLPLGRSTNGPPAIFAEPPKEALLAA